MFKRYTKHFRTLLIVLVLCTICSLYILYNESLATLYFRVWAAARNNFSDVAVATPNSSKYFHPQNEPTSLLAYDQQNSGSFNGSHLFSSFTTRTFTVTTPIMTAETGQQKTGNTVSVTPAKPFGLFMADLNNKLYYEEVLKINMENKDGCQNASSYDAIMGVTTAPRNLVNRQAFRWLYSDFNQTYPYKIKVWFFIGKVTNSTLQSELASENEKYGDLVQGNYIDAYRNLTYKTIFTFYWLNKRCAGLKRMLRLDDDVFLRIGHFFYVWNTKIKKEENTIMCDSKAYDPVFRSGKWAVEKSEVPEDKYDFQRCLGYFVAVTSDLVSKMDAAARRTRFFWLEDIFMYGFVAKKVGAKFENVGSAMFRFNEHALTTCLKNQNCHALTLITSPNKFQMLYSLKSNITTSIITQVPIQL